MKLAKLVVCLGSVAMPWASAAKLYNVTLNYPTEVRGTELKPVLTEFEIAGDKAMIHGQEQTVEASIKVQEGDQAFSATTLRYSTVEGKYRIDEIH
jgi:hypothetical protein